MAHSLSRYTWVLNVVVIAICATLASKALGKLAEIHLPVVLTEVPAVATTVQLAPSDRDVSSALRRNVFCSTCPAQTSTPPPASGQQPLTTDSGLTHTTLQVQLIATLVSEDTTRDPSYAAIRAHSGSTTFYGVGSRLQGAMIITITERRITLLNNGRLEFLDLLRKLNGVARTAALGSVSGFKLPPAGRGLGRIARGIRKVGEGKYEIRKESLKLVLASPHVMAKGGQVIPVMSGGKPSGIMLRRIRSGSVYSLLGLFSGDTITAVNGRAMTSPEAALQLYVKLRNASHLSVAFTRRGKQLTHDYNIR